MGDYIWFGCFLRYELKVNNKIGATGRITSNFIVNDTDGTAIDNQFGIIWTSHWNKKNIFQYKVYEEVATFTEGGFGGPL